MYRTESAFPGRHAAFPEARPGGETGVPLSRGRSRQQESRPAFPFLLPRLRSAMPRHCMRFRAGV